MPTLTETYINDLKINKPTRTQLENATTLSSDELYLVNPEFAGGKLLATDGNGDIIESTATEADAAAGGTAIQGVQVDGTDLTIDANKKVNIDLTDYETKATIQTLSATDSITLADNTIYNGGEQTALTIALPATVDVSFLCEIDFSSGATATTLSYPNTIIWIGDDVSSNLFIPVASKRYTVIIAYDGVNYRATVKGV